MASAAKPAVYAHIRQTPGVCGGQPTIGDTRIRVKNIVVLLKGGQTPEQMLVEYPSLTKAQVREALTYYYDNAEEIEAALEEDEHSFDQLGMEWSAHVEHHGGEAPAAPAGEDRKIVKPFPWPA
jgi:uncharacterized protein (DUF433 family)